MVKNLFSPAVFKSASSVAIALLSFATVNMAVASDSGVVISQVYGGNGNTFNRDYVELFNGSQVAVNISGWSIQYSSATGSGLFSANGVTPLSGTLQPGQYFLVGLATVAGAPGAALPTVDAVGTTNMSGTAGKVVLVNNSTGLACNGSAAQPCNAAQTAQIVDLIGFGSANYFESAAAPAITSTTAALRVANGCTDTNNNSSDFSVGAAAPRNTSSAFNVCGGGGTPANQPIVTSCPALNVNVGSSGATSLTASDADGIVNGATQTSAAVAGINLGALNAASGVGQPASIGLTVANTVPAGSYPVVVRFTNNDAQNASCTVNVNVQAAASVTRIYNIQGSALGVASVSPLAGTSVVTEGIVTAKFSGLSGFTLQDETGDNNALTSDGIFVFGTASLGLVNVGDKIRLNANVTEFNTVTQLSGASNIQVLSTGNPVVPTDIALPEVTEGDLEAYEGMLVRITSPMTVSQNYFQGRYGQVSMSAEGRMKKPSNVLRPGTAEYALLNDKNAR
ncbi:MAG: lamin tail domain-containing protein, partial [Pseudomonadota bacterium]